MIVQKHMLHFTISWISKLRDITFQLVVEDTDTQPTDNLSGFAGGFWAKTFECHCQAVLSPASEIHTHSEVQRQVSSGHGFDYPVRQGMSTFNKPAPNYFQTWWATNTLHDTNIN